MSSEPLIAGKKPVLVALKAGKPVFWCACGRSSDQPFCNGAHKGSSFAPLRYTPEADGEALFCTCKRTRTPPFCDGSHNALSEKYAEADPNAAADALFVEWRAESGRHAAALDNGCFVTRPLAESYRRYGALALAPGISRAAGARHLSYFAGRLEPGASPVIAFPDSDAVLFAVDGDIDIEISGRPFHLARENGAFVSGSEAFAISHAGAASVRIDIAVCPECDETRVLEAMPRNFDERAPERIVGVDPGKREAMADRFYQVLVDREMGNCPVTQFIGEIPCSRAEHHRHLYEEALLVLSGEGVMWTDRTKARVESGDIIFLPMRQAHSLECTSPEGMRLMGVFFPSGSPAINY